MNFIKENWIKLTITIVVLYTFSLLFQYYTIERKLWADERLESYKKCLAHISIDSTFNVDTYKLSFGACKTVSDIF